MAIDPKDPRTGGGRPRPRSFITQVEPKLAAPQEPRRNRRADKQRSGPKRQPLSILALAAAGALAIFAAVSFLQASAAQQQLDALLTQREEARLQHEKDVGYYVQMRRTSGYEEFIQASAREFQVEYSFLSAVIARESHYDPQAQSRVGARGLMQIMEDTGTWIAGRLGIRNYRYDSLYDPELNIRFGAWYINYLSAHFDGDPVMIASAYHAGVNNVKLWALNRGADQKRIDLEQIPKDNTKDYVQKVMNAYALYYEYDSGHFYRD